MFKKISAFICFLCLAVGSFFAFTGCSTPAEVSPVTSDSTPLNGVRVSAGEVTYTDYSFPFVPMYVGINDIVKSSLFTDLTIFNFRPYLSYIGAVTRPLRVRVGSDSSVHLFPDLGVAASLVPQMVGDTFATFNNDYYYARSSVKSSSSGALYLRYINMYQSSGLDSPVTLSPSDLNIFSNSNVLSSDKFYGSFYYVEFVPTFDFTRIDRCKVTFRSTSDFISRLGFKLPSDSSSFRFIEYTYFDAESFTFSIYFPFLSTSPNFNFTTLRSYYAGLPNLTYKFGDTSQDYNTGYNVGYNAGYNSGYGVGNSQGITDGRNLGYTEGYQVGNSDGYNTGFIAGVANSNDYSFLGLFGAVFDAPIKAFTGLLSFDVFGVDLSAFVLTLFSLCIVIKIIQLVL